MTGPCGILPCLTDAMGCRGVWETRWSMPKESHLRRICRAEFDCNPRTFLRAASQRFQTANLLLTSGVSLDAVYLGGYVVECSLKALILDRTPSARRYETCRQLTSGARSHNFDVLSEILRARGIPPPSDIRVALDSLCDEWNTDLRYIGAVIPRREAEDFLRRVRAVHDWVRRSL